MDKWKDLVEPFARALGVTLEDATERLKPLVGAPSAEAAELLQDANDTPDADIKACFASTNVPAARVNRAIRELRKGSATATAAAAAGAQGSAPAANATMLPNVPDDDGLLEALKVGGVAKVSETDVAAAVRVLLAQKLGLYGIEARIAAAIEERAVRLGEPVGPVFYRIEKEIGRRRYAEVLAALGASGDLVTERRKTDLLARVAALPDLLLSFQERLGQWQDQWMQRISNPGALFAGFAALMGGAAPNPAASTMMEAPDTGPVVDAVAGLIDRVNAMFAGTGIPVARALAADAIATRRVLDDQELTKAVGASSREEMLKTLGIGVSADIVRADKDIAQYILGVMQVPRVSEQQRPGYIVALQQLGAQIPWELLTGKKPSAKPSGRPFPGDDRRSF